MGAMRKNEEGGWESSWNEKYKSRNKKFSGNTERSNWVTLSGCRTKDIVREKGRNLRLGSIFNLVDNNRNEDPYC